MKKIYKNNLLLFIPLFILMVISFFCMYQARFIKPSYHNYLFKQVLWFILGFITLLLIRKIKIRVLFEYSFYLYLLGIILLFLVLIFGNTVNGAKAWFNLKIFNFQPSELVKITLTLYLAKQSLEERKSDFKYILKCLIITLIPSILVFLEPDTGAIIFYFLILLSTLLISKIKKRWFIIFFSLLFILITAFFYLYFNNRDVLINTFGSSLFYRMDRIINFKNKTGMQLENALVTIGASGFKGNFIKKELLYVPELPTDFVFTLVISIFGFLGALVVLFAFILMNSFLLNVYSVTSTFIYKSFVNSFIIIFLFQQVQNISMNIGLLPIMGIPLPFLSYGGSNMVVYFIFLGIILNIKKQEMNLVYLP